MRLLIPLLVSLIVTNCAPVYATEFECHYPVDLVFAEEMFRVGFERYDSYE